MRQTDRKRDRELEIVTINICHQLETNKSVRKMPKLLQIHQSYLLWKENITDS